MLWNHAHRLLKVGFPLPLLFSSCFYSLSPSLLHFLFLFFFFLLFLFLFFSSFSLFFLLFSLFLFFLLLPFMFLFSSSSFSSFNYFFASRYFLCFISHVLSTCSWYSYAAMNRIFKHYAFKVSRSPVTQVMSFSSYPGILSSLDDFYIMDRCEWRQRGRSEKGYSSPSSFTSPC